MTLLDLRGAPAAVFSGSAALRDRLVGWDAAIRRPVGAARRIAFVHIERGPGATTLAHETLRIAAARRAAAPLAVDVSTSGALTARLGAGPTSPSAVRRRARRSAEATDSLGHGAHGEWVLRPAQVASGSEGAVGAWIDDVAPVTRFFDIVITDFGLRHPQVDLAPIAALSDAVCVVARSEREPAELALSVAAALGALPEAPHTVLALVHRRSSPRPIAAALAEAAPLPVLSVPYDTGLARGLPVRTLRGRTALLAIAAELIGGTSAEGSARDRREPS